MSEPSGEYVEAHYVGMEIIWGKGYMSPGGDDEVASVVDGVDIRGKGVLEIGSGLGGSAVALAANHDPGRVIGIDIQKEQIERATRLAERRGLSDRVEFRLVEPGPLPFADESFDVVFSMGTFVQIADKPALFAEIFRVLRRGGTLAANDWLRDRPLPLSEELVNLWRGWSSPITGPHPKRCMTPLPAPGSSRSPCVTAPRGSPICLARKSRSLKPAP